ncbi:tail fiber domain-containing protein [Niabella sp. CC-SYL272]|uniref:tail fiber domain-containing protein n=1 Tax=Niabella agricola TaxID=2891571 RepID=UPI001F373DD1|nr:tail fiber domain-containing protein [Niabella agricola]MCF3109748.1 tail fiber domain-containing protein [Niabella agricola]
MKLKLFLFALIAACLSIPALSQVPLQFAFQGVARNSNGQAAANQKVSVRFTIHQGAETGGQVFQETHAPTTNAAGVFNVVIGSKTAFPNTLNWSNNVAYYLQVEIDPAGGSSYATISTSQLLSVPYAIAASRLVATGSTVLSATGTTIGSSGNKALAANATAMGYNTMASGESALSIGGNTQASGNYSFAMGLGTEASGPTSFSAGSDSRATSNNAIAMGLNTEATGLNTFAAGPYSRATSLAAVAVGYKSVAAGTYTMAVGSDVLADGDYSTAMGNNVKTGTFKGAFIIGDYRPIYTTSNSAENQMVMRFGGGYRFYTGTNGFGNGSGVSLDPNGNSWASISDSTKKENYRQPNGAVFLSKIKGMKLGSWNYKGQEKQQYRHYGPMAQEFHSLFGNDGVGTVGNDTTIASADIDGVMMIALQALTKQTEALENRIRQTETLQNQVKQLAGANQQLQKRVQQLEATIKEK